VEKIMPDKLRLNLEYLERAGFWYDIQLILKTLWRVVSASRG
jgi:lipopolysaccharide/colanic/teichoic acid biosynthesis glycosyltransferase